jgi:protein-tyrosine-phosphatase
MWDTGSIGTCISSRLAEILGLKSVDSWQLKSIHDSKPANVYILDILLPDGISIQNVLATEITTEGEFDCIIGMNIIRLGDFSITNNNGKTVMSFRLPTANVPIDFTKTG